MSEFKVYMVNRKAVKILSKENYGTRIQYIKTGKQCVIANHLIRTFKPKRK